MNKDSELLPDEFNFGEYPGGGLDSIPAEVTMEHSPTIDLAATGYTFLRSHPHIRRIASTLGADIVALKSPEGTKLRWAVGIGLGLTAAALASVAVILHRHGEDTQLNESVADSTAQPESSTGQQTDPST
jgi:hypothetical protein